MNLISKKDLLAVTGISYGQLYRWKRGRLIPEEWFIKQSSYTGQETFFPREQILSRVHSILELKDQYSLDELSDILSPKRTSCMFTPEHARSISEINPAFIDCFHEEKIFSFQYLVFLATLSASSLPLEVRISLAKKTAVALSDDVKQGVVFTTGNVHHLVFMHGIEAFFFDSEIEVVEILSLEEFADKLKMKYRNLLTKQGGN